jgi:HlyD family secretion protein
MMGMLKNRRVQFGVVVVAALVAVALWPQAVEVDVAPVTRGLLVVTVDEEGETRVRDKFVITAPVAGEVQRLDLEPGDPVTHGRTVLARIRPAAPLPLDARARGELEAAVRATQAAAERARAERDRLAGVAALAEQRRDRARRLLASGAIAQEELDVREAEARAGADALRAAGSAVAQAEYDVQIARARLVPAASGRAADIVITAPVTGVVLKRHLESAQVVAAGVPLVEIGDPQRLEVVTDLLSADAVRVAVGAEVLLEHWGGTQPLAGHVRRVEPSGFTKVSALGVEEQRVNVVIDLDGPDEAGFALGDAYRAEVRIVVWRGADVVKVPTGAVFRRGEDWAVFVVEGGRARERAVTIGQRNGREAQVLNGFNAGDYVVMYPPDVLKDGARIRQRAR